MTEEKSIMSRIYSSTTGMLLKIDIYGSPITMNFDGKESHIKTSFGGFLTVVLSLATISYSLHELLYITNGNNI